MVEEDSTDTPPLFGPVYVDEVVVAPGLEAGIESRVVAVAGRLEHAVEVTRVLRKRICRRQVGTAAEPGVHQIAGRSGDLEIADIQVHRGNHRASGMNHQAEAGHREGQRLGTRAGPDPLPKLRVQLPLDARAIHARLLEGRPLGQDAADPTAATRAFPPVFAK
jgi:hypothetical protein